MSDIIPVNKTSISKQVVAVLQDRVLSGQWIPGIKIPSEKDLCAELSVSRVSVRAAIKELIGLGFFESHQGEGTYVKEFSLREYFQRVSPLIFKKENYDETTEYRFAIESACIRFAIEYYDEQEIAKLSALCDHSEQIYKQGLFNEYIQTDYAFHRQLCMMAKNSIFLMMFDAFSLSFFRTTEENMKISPTTIDAMDRSYHEALVQAIKDKDLAKAEDLCYRIISRARQRQNDRQPSSTIKTH